MNTLFLNAGFLGCCLWATMSLGAGYGAVEISSVGLDGLSGRDTIVIHGASYTGGTPAQVAECATSAWWWPAGTGYAFWLPVAGNEEEYSLLLAAYAAEKKVWVQVTDVSLKATTQLRL